MSKFNNLGYVGHYSDNNNVISFQLGESTPKSTTTTDGVIDLDQYNNLPTPVVYTINDNYVLLKGVTNRLPDEIRYMIGNNRLLPELIEKQIRILYGKGLSIYQEEIKDNKIIRTWVEQLEIKNWLSSWKEKGMTDNPEEFAMKVIRDYYYYEDYWVRERFTNARRINGIIPLAGLEHIEDNRCRLATKKSPLEVGYDYEDQDFQIIVVGNWATGMHRNFKIYNRYDYTNPLKNSSVISYHRNSFPGEIYGVNKVYNGIKDWLVGTNRNPKYINSFLNNSMSAKVHVIIPWNWVQNVEDKLEKFCEMNRTLEDDGKTLITLFDGELELGTEYHVSLRDKYIKLELKNFSSFLSGVENQGKIYASYSYTTSDGKMSNWKIETIDQKYKEFMDALNKYDKRADEVITAAKGLDAAISGISKDGIISKSGSDLMYNYIIYLITALPIAELICCQPFNDIALKLNFPDLHKQGYRIGFYNEIPARSQDVSPNDRLESQVTEQINSAMSEIMSTINELKEHIQHGT